MEMEEMLRIANLPSKKEKEGIVGNVIAFAVVYFIVLFTWRGIKGLYSLIRDFLKFGISGSREIGNKCPRCRGKMSKEPDSSNEEDLFCDYCNLSILDWRKKRSKKQPWGYNSQIVNQEGF